MFVACHCLISLAPCLIGRLSSMPVVLLGHLLYYSLKTHAHPNILKISPPKTESFQIKILIFFFFFFFFFHFSAQNIDCGYSLKPPR